MKYLRRLVWFIASRLLALLLVLGVLSVTFYFAMNAMNIYIIVKDGMAKRAQVVMMNEPVASLDNYFYSSWLSRDELLLSAQNHTDRYENTTVTGFDHRISLQWVWCWPWESTARATITEKIPAIDGKTSDPQGVPPWDNAKYSVILSRSGENWKIRDITMIERLDHD